MREPARSLKQRKFDTLYRLVQDKDLWIATSSQKGEPYLVPLSFWWDGRSLFISTFAKNSTAQNIMTTGEARVAFGHTRDVILMSAYSHILKPDETEQCGNAFAKKSGWDTGRAKGYRFFQIDPYHVEVWREENEHADRLLMRDGKWLV